MRLIDADDLIERINAVIEHGVADPDGLHPLSAEVVLETINVIPPARSEIIRCRECKFASGDSRICMKFDHSPIGELDFCSFAERREATT